MDILTNTLKNIDKYWKFKFSCIVSLLFDIFMEETNDLATTKVLLAYLGHDFVNLNELTEEERAKYY